MKKIMYIIFLLILCRSTSFCEVDLSIDINQVEIDGGNNNILALRPIIGSFQFLQNPEPLKEITCNFTLNVADHERVVLPDGDWNIEIIYDHKNIKLLSDSIFQWIGDHDAGNQISGEITFMILTSGFNGLDIGIQGVSKNTYLKIKWNINADGHLTYLGNPDLLKENTYAWNDFTNTFFSTEQIHIIQSSSTTPSPYNSFKYDIVVEPIFHIGDTSTITYNLELIKKGTKEIDIMIVSQNFEIISYPSSFPVFSNE